MTTPPREWLDELAANIEAGYDPKTATQTERFLAVITLKMHASLADLFAERDEERTQHEATKSTLDDAWEKLHHARQTIAAAPHAPHCSSLIPVPDPPRYPCDCWKKDL
jgi:hypothetical protein